MNVQSMRLQAPHTPAGGCLLGNQPPIAVVWCQCRVSDWNFAPCSYTHDDCVAMFKGLGYDNSFGPGACMPGPMGEVGAAWQRGGVSVAAAT
jgi:hypothetical protein